MTEEQKKDYLEALRAMSRTATWLFTLIFAGIIGWLPFFMGIQEHWYWALIASLAGPSLALPLDFLSWLKWIRTKRSIEQLIAHNKAESSRWMK